MMVNVSGRDEHTGDAGRIKGWCGKGVWSSGREKGLDGGGGRWKGVVVRNDEVVVKWIIPKEEEVTLIPKEEEVLLGNRKEKILFNMKRRNF